MAAISAGGVTYTVQEQSKWFNDDGRFSAVFKISFGNGTLTYPSGGIPLNQTAMGVPELLDEFIVLDQSNSDGFVYKYGYTANTIRIYQTAGFSITSVGQVFAAAPLVELATSATVASATTVYAKITGW